MVLFRSRRVRKIIHTSRSGSWKEQNLRIKTRKPNPKSFSRRVENEVILLEEYKKRARGPRLLGYPKAKEPHGGTWETRVY